MIVVQYTPRYFPTKSLVNILLVDTFLLNIAFEFKEEEKHSKENVFTVNANLENRVNPVKEN